MEKILMISIVPSTVWIAAYALRSGDRRVALKRAVIGQCLFITAYIVGFIFILPRIK